MLCNVVYCIVPVVPHSQSCFIWSSRTFWSAWPLTLWSVSSCFSTQQHNKPPTSLEETLWTCCLYVIHNHFCYFSKYIFRYA